MTFDTNPAPRFSSADQRSSPQQQPKRGSRANQNEQCEPLAIVGIGCRLPGEANDWQSFWQLLEEGRDAITETPADRWSTAKFFQPGDAAPGKLLSRWGGHVTDIAGFDPRAFGISPREAALMDPQQRMLLEVAWRAIEDAGTPPSRIDGRDVGVFIGISSFDHAVASLSFRDRGVLTPYSNTGGSSSIAANRISYCFDLRGPSLAVDTACSSSLVAVHLACESIRRGESRMALAGGVNALLMPDFTVAFSQLGVLSPDGRCKTFDAAANGYVRGEGAGMVLIKPLQDALNDGDLIYAVIRSTASNQDGRTPGLTVPSGDAQQQLIREACRKAGVAPAEIGYVEAHGTGTPVGDPIEANAIGSVVGQGRPADSPCLIGSVKTNIGHLEAAAGIASLIKAALMVYHRRIPAHLHLQQANPAIDFEQLGLAVPITSRDWTVTTASGQAARRIAGVNGFGYGGANAHVLLEEPPAATTSPRRDPASEWVSEPLLVPLAARSHKALAASAGLLADWLERAGRTVSLPDVAAFLAHRRSGGPVRDHLVVNDRADLIDKLRQLADGADRPAAGKRTAAPDPAELAFVFSGQGPQWWGMGRRLFASSGSFRRVIERCGAEFSRYGDWSLVEELLRDEADSRLQLTRFAQPAIFAVQVGIAAVWKQWGIEPAACVGHSVGEIAAAHVAGGLSFTEACRVAFHRGRTMDLASSQGGMLAVGLSRDELKAWLPDENGPVGIAAVNGPTSLTLSGPAAAIAALAEKLEAAGVFCRRLAVEYAFHSPLMEPVREELLVSLADLSPTATSLPLFSTVTGGLIDGTALGADYWWQNVRQPVLFADAMACVATTGKTLAIEIGPHPVLAYSINECFEAAEATVETLPSLRRDTDDVATMLASLGRLHTLGLPIDLGRLHPRPHRRLPLPPEPFLTQRLREESPEARESRAARSLHPLLGDRTEAPTARWECRVDLRLQRYLGDHLVRGACVHPAAGYLEAAIAAAGELADDAVATVRLERLVLRLACLHDEAAPRWLACSHRPDRRSLHFAQRGVADSDWSELASVTIATATGPVPPLAGDLDEVSHRCAEAFTGARLYAYCRRLGLDYGEQFRGITTGRRRSGECLADVFLPPQAAAEIERYRIHPALLDACFHGMIAADRDFDHTVSGLYLPREIGTVHFMAAPGATATVHVQITDRSDERIVADLDIRGADGRLCLAIRGFISDRVAGSEPDETTADLVYRLDWVKQAAAKAAAAETAEPACWLLFADTGGRGDRLAEQLTAAGDSCILVRPGDRFAANDDGSFALNPDSRADFAELLRAIAEAAIGGVIYCWALDAPTTSGLTSSQLRASTLLSCRGPLHLIQAWEAEGPEGQLPCFFVTAGGQTIEAADAQHVEVAQTPLIGMGRVIASEYGRLRTRLVDIAGAADATALAALVHELHRDDAEDEVLLREDDRWVRRFIPHTDAVACPAACRQLPGRLEAAATAGVEDLSHRLFHPGPVGPGEVEIAVHAAGLNFSDVMKALALYPGLPPGRPVLGSECSGVITRVGPGVTDWQPGDEVIAVAPGAFATHVVVATELVARKPRNLSHQQAAALPIAFLTAIHALHECARIRAGESVLIHSASGGVGLAAMQLVRLAGGRVLATAGSEEKRAFVREQGAEQVFDSRSLGFADEARRQSGRIDAILNSLPGEAIPRGIEALAIGGRFLEIGKRDIYADEALGLYAFRNNIAFFGIDLDQLFKRQPARMGELLRSLPERFESGELKPLPVTVHPAAEAVAAFRDMRQARHIGKLVIDSSTPPVAVRPPEPGQFQCDPNASYWVAGGLGGFGLEVARWLAEQGAGTLILGGRSLQVSAAAAATIAAIEASGTRVRLLPADITRPEDVRRVLATIAAEEKPLKGIFHTAMVLEDRLLVDLDHETLDRVLWPKLLGGWNLHRESLGLDLDQFVLFSSLSSVFGHAGQANYAAANAALDGLAHYRRGLGLPATVINWGHLGEVGYLSQRDELAARLERQGVLSFTVQQAMDCLAHAITSHETQLSVLRMDWTRWRGLGITDNVPPKFAHLLRSVGTADGGETTTTISPETLRAAAPAERRRLVEITVRAKTASLLGTDPESLEADRPLLELGLDSLMAVELRNWIDNQTGVNLPMAAVMRSPGVTAVTQQICRELSDGAVDETTEQPLSDRADAQPPGPVIFPMAAGQRGLWTAFRRAPTGTAYNVFLPTRIRSPLDIDALRATMNLAANRHESLRTTFGENGGEMLQRVHPSLPPEFTVHDATGLDPDAVRELAAADAQRPFDLERGPLLRVTAYRLAADDWVVLTTTHHIAVDFWSLILLLGEIAAGYAAQATGQPQVLPPAANNYAEFVHRQQKLLASERVPELRTFWQEQLADMPTTLDLPLDHPRPTRFTGRAGSASLTISPVASAAVTSLAAAVGVTPSAVMLAAVKVLLARFSGQSSFLIGMPFSGRSQRRFEDTVGFFINMLPIPARLNDSPSFRSLVERTGDTLMAALEHEDYPFAAIVADARCGFDPGRSPLFQVSCTFEKSHRRGETGRAGFLFPDRAEVVSFAGLRQESFPVPQQACVHDLEFVFEQADDGYRGVLHFCQDLFGDETVANLARCLEGLVAALTENPDSPLSDVAWPVVPSLPKPAKCPPGTLKNLLRPVSDRQPEQPAFLIGDQQWTYRDLSHLSSAVSRKLVAAGLGGDDLVPVVADRRQGMLATVATMLAGAAVLPVDAEQPAAQLADLISNTNAKAIITAGAPQTPQAVGLELPVIDITELEQRSCSGTTTPRLHPGSPERKRRDTQCTHSHASTADRLSLPQPTSDDLAYCITTSGSTGQPKGVLVEQGAITNLLTWRQQVMPARPGDRMLLLFSHQFDAALGTTLATLAAGGTVVVAEDEAPRDIARLIDQLIRDRISILPVIPSLLQLLIEHPRFGECPWLRQIWCGGEALSPALAEAVARLPGVTLWNCYGPTETTVEAAVWQVEADACRGRARLPIGQPAAGAGLMVVDDHLRPLPDGLPGELVVIGPGLARGYLGQPELTADRFVMLPGAAGRTAEPIRGYRTGDRCRRLADGNFEFLGRLDEQVKLRGYRVELGEIEICLRSYQAVTEAAVKPIAVGTPEARLAAFVVIDPESDATETEDSIVSRLHRHLAARLPAWKRPATVDLIDTIPTTASGKVDRARLPEPTASHPELAGVESPHTPLQQHLADCWRETLGLTTVGIRENFFDLGGTSLQAAVLAARLSSDLGVEVPTVLFFDLTDIAAIARRLAELHPAAVKARFGPDSLATTEADDDSHPLVVSLKPDGSLPPLFMVHPPGGIVVCYAALARQLDPDRPLIGIRSRGLHGEEDLPTSLEALAADYVTAIRVTQPAGPYLVGGWSLGGVIASEVVRQLLVAGETVDRLLLLDSALPEGSHEADGKTGREYGLELGLSELGDLPAAEQLPVLYEHARKLGLIEETAPKELVARMLGDLHRLFAHHARLCSSYQPRKLAVDAVLFRPRETPAELAEPADRGWGRLLRSVGVREVPGHHHSMVAPPHVTALAAAIDEALAEAGVSS